MHTVCGNYEDINLALFRRRSVRKMMPNRGSDFQLFIHVVQKTAIIPKPLLSTGEQGTTRKEREGLGLFSFSAKDEK